MTSQTAKLVCLVALSSFAAPGALAFSNVKADAAHVVTSLVVGESCFECPNYHYCSCIENSDSKQALQGERFMFEGKTCKELQYTNRIVERASAFPQASIYLADKADTALPARLL